MPWVVDIWTTRQSAASCPHTHNPYDDEVVLFSIIKWPCFQVSKLIGGTQSGPLFDHQVALFSLDKHSTAESEGRVWLQ